MPKFVISPAAESDIEDILAWTEDRFGERARLRYEALLVQAMVDVADDPNRTGIRVRPEIAKSTQTYHLFYSRNRVPRSVGRVKRPAIFYCSGSAKMATLK